MKIIQPTLFVVLAGLTLHLNGVKHFLGQTPLTKDYDRPISSLVYQDSEDQVWSLRSLHRRLAKTWPDMVAADDAATCWKSGTNWNNCKGAGGSVYTCKSCHESNNWHTCPDALHPGCTTDGDCYKKFTSKLWPPTGTTYQWTHLPTDGTTYNVGKDADYFTSALACEPIHCFIIGSTSNPNWGQTWDQSYLYDHTAFVTLNKLTGIFSFTRQKPFYLNIEFRCDSGFLQFNYAVDISVTCTATSTTLSKPGSWVQHQTYVISLTDTWEPHSKFDDFITSDPHCPIESRNVYRDAGYSQPLSNGLLTTVYRNQSTTNNHEYYVMTSMPLKYKKGVYGFYIRAMARGGATLDSGAMSLTVVCGPASTNITESDYEHNQVYEVGSSHGFYFKNFSSFSDCPALTYRILKADGTNNLHTDFPLGNNISVTNQSFLMVANVQDTTVQKLYSFRIEVTAEGGYKWTTAARSLEYKCFSNLYSITAPFDLSQKVVYYKGVPGTWEKYLYSNFTTGHAYCHVTQYELDDNADWTGLVTPADTRWNAACDSLHLCSDIEIKTDYLRNYTFWLVVYADGNLKQSWPINVVVKCGLETLTLTQPSWTRAWRRLAAGSSPYNVNLITEGIASIFVSSLSQCPVVEYNLFNDPEMQWPILDNTTLELNYYQNPSLTSIDVNSTVTFYRTVYLQAVTEGNITIALPMTFAVCGYEEQYAKREVTDFVYEYQTTLTPNLGPNMTILEPMFWFDATPRSSSLCENKALALYEDAALTKPWVMDPTNPTVELIDHGGDQYSIKVYDNNKFREKILYLTRETWGGVKAGAPLAFEVCGLEKASLRHPYNATVQVNYTQYTGSGLLYQQKIPIGDYRGNFTTESRLCPARYFEVYEKWGSGYRKNGLVKVDPSDQTILVSTIARMSKVWYLLPLGHSNKVYLPVNITIYPPDNSHVLPMLNEPPYLNRSVPNFDFTVVESKFYVHDPNISLFSAEDHLIVQQKNVKYTQTFRLPLGPIHDEFDRLHKVHVRSSFLGDVVFNNFTKAITQEENDQVLGFELENNTIIFTFTSFAQAKDHSGLHFLRINLTDDISKYRVYPFTVNIRVLPFSEYNFSLVDESNFPKAKVTSVSPYGDVTIVFSKVMNTEGLSASDIDSSLLDVYLAPSEEWHTGYDNFNLTKFNLTWNVTAFHANVLVIKVNFTDPRYVSAQKARDMLVINIKDTADVRQQTFSRIKSGRQLLELTTIDGFKFTEQASVLEAPVNRQVPHNWEYLNWIFSVMTDVMWTCLWLSIFLNFFFGFPLTLMVCMLNSISYVMHFPLLEVYVPMNAMLYLQRVLPVGNYDLFQKPHWMQRWFRTSDDHYEVESIRPQVAFLGYDQFNPFVNVGTIALFLWIYLVQLCLFSFLVFSRMVWKRENSVGWRRKVLTARDTVWEYIAKHAFFGQILWLLILGFMPIITAAMLTFVHDPKAVGYNVFTAVMYAFFAMFLMPVLLALLLSRKNWKAQTRDSWFLSTWGTYFRGIKLQHRRELCYHLVFFLRRIILLTVIAEAALLASKTVQVVLVHTLNLLALVYIGYARPFNRWSLNFLAFWDEMLIFMCTCHLNCFTEWVDDVEMQYDLGISLIVFMNLHIWVTLAVALFALARGYCVAARYLAAVAMLKFRQPWLVWLVHPWDSMKYTWYKKWLPKLRASKTFGPCARRVFGRGPEPDEYVNPFAIVRDFTDTSSSKSRQIVVGDNSDADIEKNGKKQGKDPGAYEGEPVDATLDKDMDAWIQSKIREDPRSGKEWQKPTGKNKANAKDNKDQDKNKTDEKADEKKDGKVGGPANGAPKLDPYQPTHFLVGGRLLKHVDGAKGETVERAIIANNAEVVNNNDRWKHQAQPNQISGWDWRNFGQAFGLAYPEAKPQKNDDENDVTNLLSSLQELQKRAKERYGEGKPKQPEEAKAQRPRPNDIGMDDPEEILASKDSSVANLADSIAPGGQAAKPARRGGPVAPAEKLALAPRMIHLASALQPLRGGPIEYADSDPIEAEEDKDANKSKKEDEPKSQKEGSDPDDPEAKKGKKKNKKHKGKKRAKDGKKTKDGKQLGPDGAELSDSIFDSKDGDSDGSEEESSETESQGQEKGAANKGKEEAKKNAIKDKLKEKMKSLSQGVKNIKDGAANTIKRGIDQVVNPGNRYYQDGQPMVPLPDDQPKLKPTADSADLEVQSIEAGESAHNQVGDLGDLEQNSDLSAIANQPSNPGQEPKILIHDDQPNTVVNAEIDPRKSQDPRLVSKNGMHKTFNFY